MTLSEEDQAAFVTDGLIVKRRFVSDDIVKRARSLIDAWYETGIQPSKIPDYTQRTFAPELGNHPDLLALFHSSGAVDVVRDLIGDFAPVETVQIQIRLPDRSMGLEQPAKSMHVDGVACPHLDPTELRTFSLLVGIVLSEVPSPEHGALRYFRAGHVPMAEWFRREWSLGISEQVPPQIADDSGTAFLGQPGDMLLMHHLVPHSVGSNQGEQPRIMAYFRVSHRDHASRRLAALKNPWLDYPPLARP
jgi:hypothetical protein